MILYWHERLKFRERFKAHESYIREKNLHNDTAKPILQTQYQQKKALAVQIQWEATRHHLVTYGLNCYVFTKISQG